MNKLLSIKITPSFNYTWVVIIRYEEEYGIRSLSHSFDSLEKALDYVKKNTSKFTIR